MTHDERISSYIDNELSAEQEQEFLISLAASDGLRKSFRSELVMKNVMHKSEPMPPRRMRGAVFAAVGIGAASTIATEHASAHATAAAARSTTSAFKSLFATKIGALVTVAGIGTSALVGYGVRTALEPAPVATHRVVTQAAPTQQAPGVSPEVAAPLPSTQVAEAHPAEVSDRHQHGVSVKHGVVASKSSDDAKTATSKAGPVNTVVGGGLMSMPPPTVDTK